MPKKKITLPDSQSAPKFNAWVEEWMSNGGNGVKSALKVYKTTNYSSAGAIASQNLKKLKNAGAIYLENKGITYTKMLDVALSNMAKAGEKNPVWWQEIVKHAGWETPKQPDIQINTQINIKPILGGTDVQGDNGNQEDPETQA